MSRASGGAISLHPLIWGAQTEKIWGGAQKFGIFLFRVLFMPPNYNFL